jgi:hypothetical protein
VAARFRKDDRKSLSVSACESFAEMASTEVGSNSAPEPIPASMADPRLYARLERAEVITKLERRHERRGDPRANVRHSRAGNAGIARLRDPEPLGKLGL